MTPGYIIRADYVPREQVSPSSIKLARMCERAWGYRYILGYKEPEESWSAFAPGGRLVVRPPKGSDELKAWNRLRRPALGKRIHSLLEDWYAGCPVNWHEEPGRILLPALRHFPHPRELLYFKTEEKIPDEFVAAITDGKHNYEFNAYIDLNGSIDGRLVVVDAKSTSDFQWAAKPDELIIDTQGIVYPLYVMWKHAYFEGTDESITPRWVYMRTEGEPAARAVDFRVTYDGARKRALRLFDEGGQLIHKIRERADPNSLEPNVGACDMYHRKCIYHHSVGGPCQAESSPGKMARAFLARGPKQEKTIMAFKKVLDSAVEQQSSDESTAGYVQPGEGAVEQTAEQAAETKAKRNYTRAEKRSGAAAKADGITVSFPDGFTLELPEASPIAGKLAAIHAAMFGA